MRPEHRVHQGEPSPTPALKATISQPQAMDSHKDDLKSRGKPAASKLMPAWARDSSAGPLGASRLSSINHATPHPAAVSAQQPGPDSTTTNGPPQPESYSGKVLRGGTNPPADPTPKPTARLRPPGGAPPGHVILNSQREASATSFKPGAPSALNTFRSAAHPPRLSATKQPAVKVQYSREELLGFNAQSLPPQMSEELPEDLFSEACLTPVLLGPFDAELVYNEWYEAIERARAERNNMRRPPRPRVGPGRPYEDTHMNDPYRRGSRGGGSWRSGPGPEGRPSSRWDRGSLEATPPRTNSRWSELNEPPQREGGQRWDRNSSSNRERGDRDREPGRWRRNSRMEDERRGETFGAPVPGGIPEGMGLDSMAEAAEKFHAEMEALRSKSNGRSTDQKEDAARLSPMGRALEPFPHDGADNGILNEPLEAGLDRPPPEEPVPPAEAIDAPESVEQRDQALQSSTGLANTNGGVRTDPQLPQQREQAPSEEQSRGLPGWDTPQQSQMSRPQAQVQAQAQAQVQARAQAQAQGPSQPNQQQWGNWTVDSQPTQAADTGLLEQQQQQQRLLQQQRQLGLNQGSSSMQGNPQVLQLFRQEQQRQEQQRQEQQRQEQQRQEQQRQEQQRQEQLRMQQIQQQQQQQQNMQRFMQAETAQKEEWFYRDPQGNVQGPFERTEMKKWLDYGYFDLNLQVRCGRGNGPFVPLGQLFGTVANAFVKPKQPQPISPQLQGQTPQMMQMLMMQQQQQQQHPAQQQQQQPQQQPQMFPSSPLAAPLQPNAWPPQQARGFPGQQQQQPSQSQAPPQQQQQQSYRMSQGSHAGLGQPQQGMLGQQSRMLAPAQHQQQQHQVQQQSIMHHHSQQQPQPQQQQQRVLPMGGMQAPRESQPVPQDSEKPDFLASFGMDGLGGIQTTADERSRVEGDMQELAQGREVLDEKKPVEVDETAAFESEQHQLLQRELQGEPTAQRQEHAVEPSTQVHQLQQPPQQQAPQAPPQQQKKGSEEPSKSSKKKKKSKKQQNQGQQAEGESGAAKQKRSSKKEERKGKAQAQAQAQPQAPVANAEEAIEKAAETPAAPAWGGVSMSGGGGKQSLSLQQIQEQEEAMRRRQVSQQASKPGDNMTMAARIAKAAGISTTSPPPSYVEPAAMAAQQTPHAQASKSKGKSKSKSKSKTTPEAMADMSVDLKRMLGVGGESRGGKPSANQGGAGSPGDSAWGKGGASRNVSLREIQAEEHRKVREREQQVREQQRMAGGVKGPVVAGAWASRSNAMQAQKSMSYSGTVKAAAEEQDDRLWDYDNGATQQRANNHKGAAGGGGGGSAWGSSSMSAADVVAKGSHPGNAHAQAHTVHHQNQRSYKQPVQQQQQQRAVRRDDSARNAQAAPSHGAEGGIKKYPEFYEWCKAELKQLGANDPTLAELCFSVDSVGDIREYMHGGLGSTPKVSAFASAFIDRKAQLLKTGSTGHKGRPGVDAAGFTAVTGSKKNRRKKAS